MTSDSQLRVERLAHSLQWRVGAQEAGAATRGARQHLEAECCCSCRRRSISRQMR